MVDLSLSCARTFDSVLSRTTVWLMYRYPVQGLLILRCPIQQYIWLMYRYPAHGLLTRRCLGQRYGFDVSLSCARTFDSALSGTTVWLMYRYPVQGLLTPRCPGQRTINYTVLLAVEIKLKFKMS